MLLRQLLIKKLDTFLASGQKAFFAFLQSDNTTEGQFVFV